MHNNKFLLDYLPIQEVGMKFSHLKLSNLIGQFELTMVVLKFVLVLVTHVV